MMESDLGVVIVAGGAGGRFASVGRGGAVSKLFASLPGDNTPLFVHSVRSFAGLCPEDALILVVRRDLSAEFADALSAAGLAGKARIVEGGETRSRSACNGLKALPESAEFAAVHDAARPFASADMLLNCLEAARKFGGAVVAKRVVDTVKLADDDGFIVETVDRDRLWFVETPQIFRRADLLRGYEKAFAEGVNVSDDAGAAQLVGIRPFLVEWLGDNRKITFPKDLANI